GKACGSDDAADALVSRYHGVHIAFGATRLGRSRSGRPNRPTGGATYSSALIRMRAFRPIHWRTGCALWNESVRRYGSRVAAGGADSTDCIGAPDVSCGTSGVVHSGFSRQFFDRALRLLA